MAKASRLSTDQTGRTAAGRVNRIPLDYYYHSDSMTRWRRRILAVAVVATCVFLSLCLNWSRGNSEDGFNSSFARWASSHGEISETHSAWANNCEVCHRPFEPIRDTTILSFFAGFGNQRLEKSPSCVNCHQEDLSHGCRHTFVEEMNCATCHHEHRGKENPLTKPDDAACVACHQNLSQHKSAEAKSAPSVERLQFWDQIRRFAPGQHPEFASLVQGDPGNIKFNHHLHLANGQGYGDQWESKMPPPVAIRSEGSLRKQQLECSDCHTPQLDKKTSDFTPIVYQTHCSECHPMSKLETLIGSSFALADSPKLIPGREQLYPTDVAHGLELDRLQSFLRQQFATIAVYSGTELDQRIDRSKVRMPGQMNSPALPDTPAVFSATDNSESAAESKELRSRLDALEQVTDEALRNLLSDRSSCTQCHRYQISDGDSAMQTFGSPPEMTSLEPGTSRFDWSAIQIAPANIPTVWLAKSQFHHHAHRMVDCAACHAGAYPQDTAATYAELIVAAQPEPRYDDERVLIPGMETCTPCHTRQERSSFLHSSRTAGIRNDCILCHQFHANRANSSFEFKQPFQTPEDFLRFQRIRIDGAN